ncbi:hypothetical protein Ddye_009012, partial [Dipteronia dyeriana]
RQLEINTYCVAIKILFYQLYDEYRRIYGPSLNISVPQNENVSQTRSFGVLGAWSALLSQKIKRLRGSSSSSSSSISYDEIETYRSTNFELIGDDDVDKFDILHWWREHEKHFPILSIIAKQILATPVSTVVVEQEFSAGENILDVRREKKGTEPAEPDRNRSNRIGTGRTGSEPIEPEPEPEPEPRFHESGSDYGSFQNRNLGHV